MDALDDRLILGSNTCEVGHEVLNYVAPRKAVDAGPDIVVEFVVWADGRLGCGSSHVTTPLLLNFIVAAVGIAKIVELLARGYGRHFDPIDDNVDIEVSVGQNTPQRSDRIDNLTISAGDKHPQQRQYLWHQLVESIGH